MSFVQFVRMTPRFAYWAELKEITDLNPPNQTQFDNSKLNLNANAAILH